MATGLTDYTASGTGEGSAQWIPPFELKDNTGTALFSVDASGNVVAAGSLTAGSVIDSGGNFVFNEAGAALDARFEGDTDANLLFTDGSTDRVGIGTATPAVKLDVVGAMAASTTIAAGTALSAGTTIAAGTTLSAGTLFRLAGIETGLTAAAGGTQAGALALSATKAVHVVTVCATNGDSVILPSATGSGAVHMVSNQGAADLQLFAALTQTINGVASATGNTVGTLKSAVLTDYAAGVWFMVLSA